MRFCRYEIPMLLRDGFEFLSLDFVREAHGAGAKKPEVWATTHADIIAQIKKANYAHVDGGVIEYVKFERGVVHTYALQEVATAYAFFLGEDTGRAFAGGMFELTKALDEDKRELPRRRVDICKTPSEDKSALLAAAQELEAIEQEIHLALAQDFGPEVLGEYPPQDVIVRLTGAFESEIVSALRRINPDVALAEDPHTALMQVGSASMLLLDHKFRLICAHSVFDALLEEGVRAQGANDLSWVEELIHDVVEDGLEIAGGFLEEGLNAAENFMLAVVDSKKHQFQVVYDGLHVRAQVVAL